MFWPDGFWSQNCGMTRRGQPSRIFSQEKMRLSSRRYGASVGGRDGSNDIRLDGRPRGSKVASGNLFFCWYRFAAKKFLQPKKVAFSEHFRLRNNSNFRFRPFGFCVKLPNHQRRIPWGGWSWLHSLVASSQWIPSQRTGDMDGVSTACPLSNELYSPVLWGLKPIEYKLWL